jgi:hypothetical protein
MTGENVYIYGRRNPNSVVTPPAVLLPNENTSLIGNAAATFYDPTWTGHEYPTAVAGTSESMPNQSGYWVRGNTYFESVTAEVR